MPILLGVALLPLVVPQPASSVDKFRYQPQKITSGSVYHYVKTNTDGSHPQRVSLFVAARDRLESFKLPSGATAGALVVAQMDWDLFCATSLESWQVFAGGKKVPMASLRYDARERAALVTVPALGKTAVEKTAIGYLPFHVYNFDFASLNLAFRHLRRPEGDFTIGVADPTFQKEGAAFRYRGEAEVSFVGEDRRASVACRKYRVSGKGVEGRGGIIWVAREGEHVVDMEIDLPDHPGWKSFKFRLLGTAQMSREEWEAFMRKQWNQ
jgi:hypothetical protein